MLVAEVGDSPMLASDQVIDAPSGTCFVVAEDAVRPEEQWGTNRGRRVPFPTAAHGAR